MGFKARMSVKASANRRKEEGEGEKKSSKKKKKQSSSLQLRVSTVSYGQDPNTTKTPPEYTHTFSHLQFLNAFSFLPNSL